ncbi:ribosome biogenesis protein tsr1 [Lecanora helva]
MAPMLPHHHRSDTKASHKPFKTRHASKNSIRELAKGKIESTGKRSSHRKTPHQQVMSKFDRKNQAKQMRQIKHQQNQKSASIFAGHNGAPRIVAVIPLFRDLDAVAAIQSLNQAVDAESIWPLEGHMKVRINRFKQNLVYVPVRRDLLLAMDACRCADFVIFLLSPMEEPDEEGELFLKAIEGQGVSNVLTMVQNLNSIESTKARSQIVISLKSFITHFFPTQEKVLSLDSESECANVIRSLCTTTPKGIKWREDRSWLLSESVQWPTMTDPAATQSDMIVTGVVRGRSLKADRLVHVGDWGHFQIGKITDASLPLSRKRKAEEMNIDDAGEEQTLEEPTPEQEDLDELAPYEAIMDDVDASSVLTAPKERRGVLLDDHHYFSDDEGHLPEAPKRLPKGTSSYQAAWFLGDMSDSGSDFEEFEDDHDGDIDMSTPAMPADGLEGLAGATQGEPTEAAPTEYPQSEMFLDPAPDEEAAQLAEYRASRKNEAEEDLEFPDEIELHPNVLARERLARYRGLKSLKTSYWETSEDRAHEPEDWNRLLQVPDYKRAKKQADNDALIGGVQPGRRVHVHLRNVPLSLQQHYKPGNPLALYSVLRHEQKRTVVNFSMTLHSDYPQPLKSKTELVVQCGPRRFVINPLFSQLGNTPNDVHKFQRYLHPGQTAVASFISPLTWGSVPALFFEASSTSEGSPLKLIATGTSLPPSTSRIIAKRVILTGHPYKIHKKLVTVRYMFFNKEDVNWFKALQLWTKRGRSGFIKESLGTHGYFKATFDGRINPQDAVGVSLYKRVWPRQARPWREGDALSTRTVSDV